MLHRLCEPPSIPGYYFGNENETRMNRLPQASWLLRRELADDDGVIAAAALLERGAHDAVVYVFRGREDNARIQVVLADVVVLGQDFDFVVFQTQLGVELVAGHVCNVVVTD